MPKGKGTYGKKVGRPPKKAKRKMIVKNGTKKKTTKSRRTKNA